MEAAQRRGEPVPDPDTRFDSNCITPGTRGWLRGTWQTCWLLALRAALLGAIVGTAGSSLVARLRALAPAFAAHLLTAPLMRSCVPLSQPSWRGWAPTSASSSARRLRRIRPGRSQPSSSAVCGVWGGLGWAVFRCDLHRRGVH